MKESINILIIEDDEDINRLLCNIVRKSGYSPKAAYSGTEAIIYLDNQKWDMVLIDLILPGLAGEDVLEKVSKESNIPIIIIISANLETQTKINTLRAGADDYITKPFDIEEVSARIDSCLRRYHGVSPTTTNQMNHKDMIMDTNAKIVKVNGKELKLTAREYEILFLLMSSPTKVFSKANLFESVWNENFYGDENILNVHLSNIRSKLAKANENEEYIETIWGMGYKLKS